ncbi:hypothetical protein NL676_015387 [Syzygium grande]|nr:hypothetical protein NL676_015387 [Syzygium grande]
MGVDAQRKQRDDAQRGSSVVLFLVELRDVISAELPQPPPPAVGPGPDPILGGIPVPTRGGGPSEASGAA